MITTMKLIAGRDRPTSARSATATRTATSSTAGSSCSRSPTAWAATGPARSRARPRSRRCAPRSRRAPALGDAIIERERGRVREGRPTTTTSRAWAPRSPRSSPTARGVARRPRRRLARVPAPRRRARASSPTDHSLVEEMVREGRITEEQAAVHPQRSIITRALGVEADVEVDVYSVPLHAGDRLLHLLRRAHRRCCAPTTSPRCCAASRTRQRAANALVDAANAAGGEDNITAVVIDVEDDGADPLGPGPAAAPVARRRHGAGGRRRRPPARDAAPAAADAARPTRRPGIPAAIAARRPDARGRVAPPTGLPEGASAAAALAQRHAPRTSRSAIRCAPTGRFVRFLVPILLILGLAGRGDGLVRASHATTSPSTARDGHRLPGAARRPARSGTRPSIRHTTLTKDDLPDGQRAGRPRPPGVLRPGRRDRAFIGRVEAQTSTTSTRRTTTTTTHPRRHRRTTTIAPVPPT